MDVEIKIDHHVKEPKVIIVTDKMTDELGALIDKLQEDQIDLIAGFQEDKVEILDPHNIYRIFTEQGKVVAETDHGHYQLRLRLYELEEILARERFVRISNGEIINLKKVKNFDLSFVGTIYVSLTNGSATYVSRRYVAKIKKRLGM